MMANILITGNATLDIINHVDHYPDEDEEIRAQWQRISCGGNAANTATVLSQLGHYCHLACTLADDASGSWIRQDLAKNNINFDAATILPNSSTPTSYITLNQQNGSRSIVHYRDLAELSKQQFDQIDPSTFDWFHFEARNIDQLAQMMQQIAHFNAPISLEVEKQRPKLDSVLCMADIIMFSSDFAQAEGFQTMEQCLNHQAKLYPDKTLSCTWGEQGAMLIQNNKRYTSSVFSPPEIIDTIGAGDTFNAGFIHALLNDFPLPTALEHACRLAGNKCGQHGFANLIPQKSNNTHDK
ncbi:MAG: PfkB family carbohydrate kinase [Gammaproteobacteria bacterium]|nr:PfkB family carbohydrate kinase [Gammaproteobacteria bacterium]